MSRNWFGLGLSVLGMAIGVAYGLWEVHTGAVTGVIRHVQSCVSEGPGILSCKTKTEVISPMLHVYPPAGIGLLAGIVVALLPAWLARRNRGRHRRGLQGQGRPDQRLLR